MTPVSSFLRVSCSPVDAGFPRLCVPLLAGLPQLVGESASPTPPKQVCYFPTWTQPNAETASPRGGHALCPGLLRVQAGSPRFGVPVGPMSKSVHRTTFRGNPSPSICTPVVSGGHSPGQLQ